MDFAFITANLFEINQNFGLPANVLPVIDAQFKLLPFFRGFLAGALLFLFLADLCALKTRKVFNRNAAKQINQAVTRVAFFTLLVSLGFASALIVMKGDAAFSLTLEAFQADLSLAFSVLVPATLCFVLLLISSLLRKKPVHTSGPPALLVFLSLLVSAFFFFGSYGLPEVSATDWCIGLFEQCMALFVNAPATPLPLVRLLGAVFYGLALSALFAMLWLMRQRNRIDYGRDYYAFATRFCAKYVLFSLLVRLGTFLFVFYGGILVLFEPPLQIFLDQLVAGQLFSGLTLLVCLAAIYFSIVLIMTVVANSQTPMRHKPGIIFSFLCCLVLEFCEYKLTLFLQ